MTVGEAAAILATLDQGYELRLSSDSCVYGDGCMAYPVEHGPSVGSINVVDGFAVLWPDADGWDWCDEKATKKDFDNSGGGE